MGSVKRLFHEHFIWLDSGDVRLTIDPIINFEFGSDDQLDNRDNPNLYKNTRGFVARLQLGKKSSIGIYF